MTEVQPNSPCTKIGADGQDLPADAEDWIVVRDPRTSLDWAKEPVAVGDWFVATQERIAAEFTESRLAGLEGWRIPTLEEMVSIVDRGTPSINEALFPDCPKDWFWTSTVFAPSPGGCAWLVGFLNGYANWGDRYCNGFVRAVRASQ